MSSFQVEGCSWVYAFDEKGNGRLGAECARRNCATTGASIVKNIKSIAAGLLMTAATLGFAATSAHAVVITVATDALLTGSSLITFSEVSNGTLDPTISGVTFDGIGGTTRTNSGLLSNSQGTGGVDGINYDILFATAVNAFGGQFRVINRSVTIEAFNGLTLLGSTSFNPGNPTATVFRGLGGFGSGITNARVSITTSDIILLDNFRFGGIAVPEPGTLALFGLGLVGLGFARRRKAA